MKLKLPMTLLIISTLIACNTNLNSDSTNDSGVVLAVPREAPSGEVMYFTALLRNAVLEVQDNCVRLRPSNEAESYLPIFPYGYSVGTQAQNLVVLRADGEVFARLGMKRDIGGGEMAKIREEYLAPSVQKCRGPYWIVSP